MANIKDQTYQSFVQNYSNNGKVLKMMSIIFENEQSLFIQLLLFCINSAIILFFILDFIYVLWKKPTIKQQEQIYRIVSFILQVYEYLIFIPSLRWSILGNVSVLNIVNAILTVLLMMIIELNDFDFRFSENADFLAKRNNFLSVLRIFFDLIGHIVLKSTSNLTLPFTFPITVIIGYAVPYTIRMKICNYSIYQKNFQVQKSVQQNKLIQNKYSKEDSNNNLDIFLRDINRRMRYLYDEYTNSQHSIFLEYIILQHKEHCSQPHKCFCSQDSNFIKGSEQFLGENIRKQFVTEYTIRAYQSHLNNLRTDLDFVHASYFAYLIDNQAINYLFYYASDQLQKEELANQKLNVSFDQKSKIEQSNQTCLYDIILFDEQYFQTLQLMKECLLLKANLIQILGNNFVDLNLVYQTSSQLIKQKKILQRQLIQLHAQNECNQELLNICSIFEKALQFSEKLNIFKKKANKFSVINKLPLRSSDSCVIFVSLMNNFGNIIRVSKNFQEVITSHTNQEATNSSLSIIIPNQIYEAHQHQLKYYLQNEENTNHIKNFPLQIASSKEGWAIPLSIKTQYHQIGEQEIGVSAWIRKQENNSNQYLSLLLDENEKKCSPVVMSQALFENIFKEVYTQKHIQHINMDLLAPALYNIIEKCGNILEETYIIKPLSKAQLSNNQLDYNNNQSYFNDIFEHNEIFYIQFQAYRSQSKYINLAQLELVQVTRIEEKQLKYESLKQLNIQLTKYCNYNSPKQYETIQINIKQLINFTDQNIMEIQSSDESSLQPTPQMINQSANQKQKNQVCSLQKFQDNTISFDNKQLFYEEVQLYHDKEETFLDQNNITSRNLLNQTSTLYEIDNLLLIQGTSSTQLELQKGKSTQQQNSQSLTNSIFKNKNNDINIEQLINNCLQTKQTSGEQLSPVTKQNKKLQFKDQSELNQSSNKAIKLFQNAPVFVKKPAQVKMNEYEQSVSSMKTTNSKTKKEIINSIKSSKRMLGLTLLNYIGIIALVTIFLIILINFINLQNFLQIQKKSFDYLDWNSDLRIALSSVQTDLYINSLINMQLLVPKDPKNTIQYVELFLNHMQQQRIYYSNLTSQYSMGNKDEIQSFKLIMEKNFMYIHSLDGVNYTTNFSLGYILIMQKSYLDQFRLLPEIYDINSIITIYDNFQNLDDTLKKIQDSSFDDYRDDMNQLLSQQEYNLITISLITLTCAISIVPIYQFIQKKRQQILKLMTNISPEKLRQMLETTSNCLFQIDSEIAQQEKQKNTKKKTVGMQKESGFNGKQYSQGYFSNMAIQKKKNISQTSNFARINFKYLLGSLAFFILLQIYSFSIYVIIQMYYDNSINNRLFMDQLAEARHFLQIQVGSLYIGFVAKLQPEVFPTSPQPLFDQIKQLQASSSTYLNNIYDYQNNFYGHSRYKQDNYNQYLIKILEKSSCDIIKDNPKYLSKDIDFDYNQCKQAGEQLLDKGLIQSLKSIFEFNGQITDLYSINDRIQFYLSLKNFDSSNTLIESPLTIQQVSIVIQQLNYFLEVMTNDLFDYLIFVNVALLISQISATIIVLVFGWYPFYERMEKSLHNTKYLLEVIDIDVLLSNSYVISYFKTNK
ncbi:hypothetical protein ABPG74_004235 [Tetrahymena malaccensis]